MTFLWPPGVEGVSKYFTSQKKQSKSIDLNLFLTSPLQILSFVGNKAKGQISKPVLQENKEPQIFRKTIISYPLIPTHM